MSTGTVSAAQKSNGTGPFLVGVVVSDGNRVHPGAVVRLANAPRIPENSYTVEQICQIINPDSALGTDVAVIGNSNTKNASPFALERVAPAPGYV